MNEMMRNAIENLNVAVGQGRPVALATRNEDGVAVRTVNLYSYEGDFYLITEANSNKFAQIEQNNHVALSVDAIQITGKARPLDHPLAPASISVKNHVEKALPGQFDRYEQRQEMRLVKVTPETASFILLDTGSGYAMDFRKNEALPIHM